MKNSISNRKIVFITATFFIVNTFSLGFIGNNVAKAGLVDQQCIAETYDIDDLSSIPLNIPSYNLAQTFTPSLTRLTFIKITVNGDGMGQVGLKLYKGDTFLKRADLVDEPYGKGEVILAFDEFELTPGDNSYKIRPYVSSGNANVSWYRKDDCYPDGKGFLNNVSQGYDFSFKTLGYNDPIPTMEVAEPEDFSETEPAIEEEASGVEEDESSDEEGDEEDEDEEVVETVEEVVIEESEGVTEDSEEGDIVAIGTDGELSDQLEDVAQGEIIEADQEVVVLEDNQNNNEETINTEDLSTFRKVLFSLAIALPIITIVGFAFYFFIKRKKQSLNDLEE